MVDPKADPSPFPANDVVVRRGWRTQEAQRRKSKTDHRLEFFWNDGVRWRCDYDYSRIASLVANLRMQAVNENLARTHIAGSLDDLRDRICWLREHAEKENPVPWARETTEGLAKEMMEILDDLLVALAGAERYYTDGYGDDR
jgi:hypothetical protein